MNTLKLKKQDGCEKIYLNILGVNTPEGGVKRVVELIDNGKCVGYEITITGAHRFLGDCKVVSDILPYDIQLVN